MMRYDANEIEWLLMEIRGVKGYFADVRINWDTVPSFVQCYELADEDSDGTPCRYRSKDIGILVDFFGSFISKDELPMDDDEIGDLVTKREKQKTVGYITSLEEFSYGNNYISFLDVMREFSLLDTE